jgi:hypothetical protein
MGGLMAWSAATESEIWDAINAAEAKMSAEQLRLWECISIIPNKWVQRPYGDLGGGFWVVAILGRFVVWFNDIEDGFNISEYSNFGEITGYGASQDALGVAVQHLVNMIANGTGRRL